MKKSKFCWFAFRPEHYRQMEAYLQEMARDGWKLRWCKGLMAEFEPAGDRNLRYVVDPYAMTSVANLHHYPRARLQTWMQEGWWGAGRSRGCQILCTEDPEAPNPVPEEDLGPQIKATCRLGSLLAVALLLAAGWFVATSGAAVYGLILTDLYLVLAALGVFLLGYHLVNIALLSGGREPGNPRICKRYVVHSVVLLLFLLAAIVLEMSGRNDMLFYLLLPILVIIVGSLALKGLAGRNSDPRRLFPLVLVMGAVLFGMIILLNGRMSQANSQWSSQRQEELLAHADRLPVLRLADFADGGEARSAVQTKQSLLGENLLYAEESETGYVFTNYTVTRSPALAERIFHYLYQQAQVDFEESFVETQANGRTLYVLEQARTALFLDGSNVYYFTVPQGGDLAESAALLLERTAGM